MDEEELRQAQKHVAQLLKLVGEDPQREGLRDTPRRVVEALLEHLQGYKEDPQEHLLRTFENTDGYNELILVSDIEVYSHCEHHLAPFIGVAHVGYLPADRIVGISKLARVVDIFSRRLQNQERLTAQIANAIQEVLAPRGVAVVIQAQHFCMCYRGVKKKGAWTTTSKLTGTFLTNPASRQEFLSLIATARQRD